MDKSLSYLHITEQQQGCCTEGIRDMASSYTVKGWIWSILTKKSLLHVPGTFGASQQKMKDEYWDKSASCLNGLCGHTCWGNLHKPALTIDGTTLSKLGEIPAKEMLAARDQVWCISTNQISDPRHNFHMFIVSFAIDKVYVCGGIAIHPLAMCDCYKMLKEGWSPWANGGIWTSVLQLVSMMENKARADLA